MMKISKDSILNALSAHSRMIYPIIIIVLMLTLTSFRISGTSIGVYHDYLYGTSLSDPNLLFGKPQTIRSDEWLVATQATIAQEKTDYSRINQNTNNKDMSLIVDVPYKDWSIIFKPQNLAFFILPFEYAFAFKWWFILSALLLSSYVFFLRILKGRLIPSILLSIIIGFTPFVFWWYQSATILSLAYGFLLITILLAIIDQRPSKTSSALNLPSISLSAALAYTATSFALILYPPFQIPIALVVALYVVGHLLEMGPKQWLLHWRLAALPIIVAAIATGLICAAFIMTRQQPIHTITNTVYPGQRVVAAGNYDWSKLFVTYLQPQLQRSDRGKFFYVNQSESSSFIVMPFFFIIPLLAQTITLFRQRKELSWISISIIACCLIFIAHLLLPGSDILSKITLLSLVPYERLTIGIGFLGIIACAHYISSYSKAHTKRESATFAIYASLFFITSLYAGHLISKQYPDFVSSFGLIALLCTLVCSALSLILFGMHKSGLLLLAIFSFASVVAIHPLYRGLGIAYNSEITKTIQQLSRPGETWGAAQDIYIENFPQMSGQKSITGVSTYPDLNFWKRYTGPGDEQIYNRYAHTVITIDDRADIILKGPDFITISSSCTRKISRQIDYIISVTPLQGACDNLIKTLHYPTTSLYFYKITH